MIELDLDALGPYLATHGPGPIEVLPPPEQLAGGFVNTLWRIDVTGAWSGALVVRRFGPDQDLERIRSEYAIHRFVWESGFPTAEPLLLETGVEVLGAPFMVMRFVAGATLMSWIDRPGPAMLRVPTVQATTMVRLHRLPTSGFPGERPALDAATALAELERTNEACGDDIVGRATGLLARTMPEPRDEPVVAHLDLTPANVLVRGSSLAGVVDWTNAHLADRHLDVADVDAVVRTAPADLPPALARMERVGRRILAARFVRTYDRSWRLDRAALPWWVALAASRRRLGAIRDAAPGDGGEPTGFTSPQYLDALAAHIETALARLQPAPR